MRLADKNRFVDIPESISEFHYSNNVEFVIFTYLPFLKGIFYDLQGLFEPSRDKVSALILSLSELPSAVEPAISGQGICPLQIKVVLADNREELHV
jgi:hypothetical protein